MPVPKARDARRLGKGFRGDVTPVPSTLLAVPDILVALLLPFSPTRDSPSDQLRRGSDPIGESEEWPKILGRRQAAIVGRKSVQDIPPRQERDLADLQANTGNSPYKLSQSSKFVRREVVEMIGRRASSHTL